MLPALRRGETDALVASHAISPQLLKEFDVTYEADVVSAHRMPD